MREILIKMLRAWILHEESWNAFERSYTRTTDECYLEVCEGNVIEAGMLELFAHWSNDIQTLSPHYGVALTRMPESSRLTIDYDVPPAPDPTSSWDTDTRTWTPADPDSDKQDIASPRVG